MNNYRLLVIFDALMCTPMPDPITGAPRTKWDDGSGFITQQAIKFRIKKYLKESGEKILHYEDVDGYTVFNELGTYNLTEREAQEKALQYLDVRLFGALDLATDKSKGKDGKKGLVKIRGPVSVSNAVTVDPITVREVASNRQYKIDVNEDGSNQGSSFANMASIVEYGLYSCYMGVNAIEGEKTGLTDEDMEKLINASVHMFDDDYSCMRPLGSMNVRHVYVWTWKPEKLACSDAKIMESVVVQHKEGISTPGKYTDYLVSVKELPIPVKDYVE